MKKLIEGQCIQWHLPTTKHDRCPQCAHPSIVQGRGGERYCTNESCVGQFRTWRLPIPVSEWLLDPDQVAYIKEEGKEEVYNTTSDAEHDPDYDY